MIEEITLSLGYVRSIWENVVDKGALVPVVVFRCVALVQSAKVVIKQEPGGRLTLSTSSVEDDGPTMGGVLGFRLSSSSGGIVVFIST